MSPSALRCLELIRRLPQLNAGCRVAKLFAKHLRPEEQAAELAARCVCAGAGTPNRLRKLADLEARAGGPPPSAAQPRPASDPSDASDPSAVSDQSALSAMLYPRRCAWTAWSWWSWTLTGT